MQTKSRKYKENRGVLPSNGAACQLHMDSLQYHTLKKFYQTAIILQIVEW